MSDTDHSGRIGLVTGANRGIGRAVAEQLAALGMTVLVAARDARRGTDTATALRAAGHDAHPVTLDVTDPASAAAAARYVDDRFGRLDVLVNNAGISGGSAGSSPSTADVDMVRGVFETNVFAVLHVTNAMLPLLRRSPAGRIVNMSSSVGSLGLMTTPGSQQHRLPPSAAYAPSKSALNALTIQYARELRETGILVNAADPGGCATDFTAGLPFTLSRTAADGARIAVRLATLGPDGPTGGYFNDEGPVPW